MNKQQSTAKSVAKPDDFMKGVLVGLDLAARHVSTLARVIGAHYHDAPLEKIVDRLLNEVDHILLMDKEAKVSIECYEYTAEERARAEKRQRETQGDRQ